MNEETRPRSIIIHFFTCQPVHYARNGDVTKRVSEHANEVYLDRCHRLVVGLLLANVEVCAKNDIDGCKENDPVEVVEHKNDDVLDALDDECVQFTELIIQTHPCIDFEKDDDDHVCVHKDDLTRSLSNTLII